MELPEAVKRKHTQSAKPRGNKKNFGKSIDLRPEIASQRTEEGHWEGDTVVGKRAGKVAVVVSLLEKKTENYLAFLIPGKTSEAVMAAMQNYSAAYILSAADELNARPRKKLGYATPEELFDSFFDRVYAVDSKPT